MRNIGLHIIGDSFDPKKLISASGIPPQICKLVNPSVEYKRRVRETVGPDCLIIVRWWQETQQLIAPFTAASIWYRTHYHQLWAMADANTLFEGYNEVADDNAILYCAFEVERLRLMHSGGFRSVVGNFSVGCPDLPVWQMYKPMLDAMRDGDLLGLHEYFGSMKDIPKDAKIWADNQYALTGAFYRNRAEYEALCQSLGIQEGISDYFWFCGRWNLVPELNDVPIVITECGRDRVNGGAGGWKAGCGADVYLDELKEYGKVLGDKLGVVFTGGDVSGWQDYDVNDLWPRVTAMYESEVIEVPEVLTVQQMQQMATEIATAAGISTTIFLRLITQESNWNPNAVNKASGCTGLGQLHPRFFQGDLLDPQYNLKTSAEYLSNLLRYFGDDYVAALAGYNWGWGNVIVARKDHGGEWLLRIPNETRRYIKRILFKEE